MGGRNSSVARPPWHAVGMIATKICDAFRRAEVRIERSEAASIEAARVVRTVLAAAPSEVVRVDALR